MLNFHLQEKDGATQVKESEYDDSVSLSFQSKKNLLFVYFWCGAEGKKFNNIIATRNIPNQFCVYQDTQIQIKNRWCW